MRVGCQRGRSPCGSVRRRKAATAGHKDVAAEPVAAGAHGGLHLAAVVCAPPNRRRCRKPRRSARVERASRTASASFAVRHELSTRRPTRASAGGASPLLLGRSSAAPPKRPMKEFRPITVSHMLPKTEMFNTNSGSHAHSGAPPSRQFVWTTNNWPDEALLPPQGFPGSEVLQPVPWGTPSS